MGFVYFISTGQFIKIGKAIDLKKRLAQLQTSSPRRLTLVHVIECADMDAIERHYHQRFADRRAVGEWFKLTQKEVRDLFNPASMFSRRGWRFEIHRKTNGLRFLVARKGRGAKRVSRYICTLKHRESTGRVVTL